MFWHDIEEMKEWMRSISARLIKIELNIELLSNTSQDHNLRGNEVEDYIRDIDKLDEIHREICGITPQKPKKKVKPSKM